MKGRNTFLGKPSSWVRVVSTYTKVEATYTKKFKNKRAVVIDTYH